jgi:hypothetical protein
MEKGRTCCAGVQIAKSSPQQQVVAGNPQPHPHQSSAASVEQDCSFYSYKRIPKVRRERERARAYKTNSPGYIASATTFKKPKRQSQQNYSARKHSVILQRDNSLPNTLLARLDELVLHLRETRKQRVFFSFHSFWKPGSFVLLLELGPVSPAVGGDVVCVLLDDGEHHHLKDHQDVLDRLLDVLHVQPEMVGFDHACLG